MSNCSLSVEAYPCGDWGDCVASGCKCLQGWGGVRCEEFEFRGEVLYSLFRAWTFISQSILILLILWRIWAIRQHRFTRARMVMNSSTIGRKPRVTARSYCRRMLHPQHSSQMLILYIYLMGPISQWIYGLDPFGGEGYFGPQLGWCLQWLQTCSSGCATTISLSSYVWVQSNAHNRPTLARWLTWQYRFAVLVTITVDTLYVIVGTVPRSQFADIRDVYVISYQAAIALGLISMIAYRVTILAPLLKHLKQYRKYDPASLPPGQLEQYQSAMQFNRLMTVAVAVGILIVSLFVPVLVVYRERYANNKWDLIQRFAWSFPIFLIFVVGSFLLGRLPSPTMSRAQAAAAAAAAQQLQGARVMPVTLKERKKYMMNATGATIADGVVANVRGHEVGMVHGALLASAVGGALKGTAGRNAANTGGQLGRTGRASNQMHGSVNTGGQYSHLDRSGPGTGTGTTAVAGGVSTAGMALYLDPMSVIVNRRMIEGRSPMQLTEASVADVSPRDCLSPHPPQPPGAQSLHARIASGGGGGGHGSGHSGMSGSSMPIVSHVDPGVHAPFNEAVPLLFSPAAMASMMNMMPLALPMYNSAGDGLSGTMSTSGHPYDVPLTTPLLTVGSASALHFSHESDTQRPTLMSNSMDGTTDTTRRSHPGGPGLLSNRPSSIVGHATRLSDDHEHDDITDDGHSYRVSRVTPGDATGHDAGPGTSADSNTPRMDPPRTINERSSDDGLGSRIDEQSRVQDYDERVMTSVIYDFTRTNTGAGGSELSQLRADPGQSLLIVSDRRRVSEHGSVVSTRTADVGAVMHGANRNYGHVTDGGAVVNRVNSLGAATAPSSSSSPLPFLPSSRSPVPSSSSLIPPRSLPPLSHPSPRHSPLVLPALPSSLLPPPLS